MPRPLPATLLLLAACAGAPPPAPVGPASPPIDTAPIVAQLIEAECDARVKMNPSLRMAIWAEEPVVVFARHGEPDPFDIRLRGAPARAAVEALTEEALAEEEVPPACRRVPTLDRLLEERAAFDATGFDDRSALRAARRPLDAPTVAATADVTEDGVVDVELRTSQGAHVEVGRYRLERQPDGWRVTRARFHRAADARLGRAVELHDADWYARRDEDLAQARAGGDPACVLPALFHARRRKALLEWLEALPADELPNHVDSYFEVAAMNGMPERGFALMQRMAEEQREDEALAVMRALTGALGMMLPAVCGADRARYTGGPDNTARPAAWRLCTPEDRAALARGEGPECAPHPEEINAALHAMVEAIGACSEAEDELFFDAWVRGDGRLHDVVARSESAELRACVTRAAESFHTPPFRLRPAEGEPTPSRLGERLARHGIELDLPTSDQPGWHLSLRFFREEGRLTFDTRSVLADFARAMRRAREQAESDDTQGDEPVDGDDAAAD